MKYLRRGPLVATLVVAGSVFANLVALVGAPPPPAAATCGYASCPKTAPDKTNIHIVAHTHDDVGWLKTVDQYYYGTNKRHNPVAVEYIIDSIIPELERDETKRFVYVEMSFFAKWWQDQDEATRGVVRKLVNEGRLEFINGGWCMNDEAVVNYQSTIEQMTLGLRFLNETFGACARPKVGWQIDPFGHSSEQAALFAQFGFDGMFFTRMGHADKAQRTQNESLDLIWHADRALAGQSGSIFTNIFRDDYGTYSGFCFDVLCYDDNVVDNKQSREYNVDRKADVYIKYLREYARVKSTHGHVLIPMGGDFHFSAARHNFKNMDKLIAYIRRVAPDLHIFYSTPSCYQHAVHRQAVLADGRRLPEKYDDFMPYDSTPTIWWSGYFSSRPSSKLVERETADLLQVARIVSLANLTQPPPTGYTFGRAAAWSKRVEEDEAKCLMPLWQILGDMQHHDAITGTEKQHVNDDYVRSAADAANKCATYMGQFVRSKLDEMHKRAKRIDATQRSHARSFTYQQYQNISIYLENTQLCPRLNISECAAIESELSLDATTKLYSIYNLNLNITEQYIKYIKTKAVLVTAYNPLAQPISEQEIRLPCNGQCNLDKVRVDQVGYVIKPQIPLRVPLPAGIGQLPFRNANTNYELLFYAREPIPALGYTHFIVEDLNDSEASEQVGESVKRSEPNTRFRFLGDTRSAFQRDLASRGRRVKRHAANRYEYFVLNSASGGEEVNHDSSNRLRRATPESVDDQMMLIQFDSATGMIVGMRRADDRRFVKINQRFGYYFPANSGPQPGAYIFRPNTSEPYLFEKPLWYKIHRRTGDALIEIHQKWADWLWQTIRIDSRRAYIEFDYVVGPIPVEKSATSGNTIGREVVTRYSSSLANGGVFMTDSNGRQMLTRKRVRSAEALETGGSFYPVVSTILLRGGNVAPANGNVPPDDSAPGATLAILVDRAQAGASLHEGQLELLVHRRHMRDDAWGVDEALNEPGEDGRGLVTRGQHRLYLKCHHQSGSPATGSRPSKDRPQVFRLPETPRANLTYEHRFYNHKVYANKSEPAFGDPTTAPTYIVHDPVLNELKQEAVRYALKPVLTFDRLAVDADSFIKLLHQSDGMIIGEIQANVSLLNATLPVNVHLLTLQPWPSSESNTLLIRLENLDNPLTLHPYPDPNGYQALVDSYREMGGDYHEIDASDNCNYSQDKLRPKVEVDIEYLIRRIRFVSLEELTLGANVPLKDDERLNWTDEKACETTSSKPTIVGLAPRQIRTFLARFEFLRK